MSKILIVTAHPDDLEYYVGGFLIKSFQQRHEIFVVIATDGSLSPQESDIKQIIKKRREETLSALRSYVTKIFFLNIKDGSLQYGISNNVIKKLNQIFTNEVHPDFVLTHHKEDYHTDHREIALLVEKIISFKAPLIYMDTFSCSYNKPDFVLDITNEFDEKQKIILKHESQMHLSLDKRIKIINNFRGLQYFNKNDKYAEVFFSDSIQYTEEIRNFFCKLNKGKE